MPLRTQIVLFFIFIKLDFSIDFFFFLVFHNYCIYGKTAFLLSHPLSLIHLFYCVCLLSLTKMLYYSVISFLISCMCVYVKL